MLSCAPCGLLKQDNPIKVPSHFTIKLQFGEIDCVYYRCIHYSQAVSKGGASF